MFNKKVKKWLSDQISDGLFVQTILCKKIFPVNKSQAHFALLPLKFLENSEDIFLGKTESMWPPRFQLSSDSDWHATLRTVQYSVCTTSTVQQGSAQSVPTVTAQMSRNIWETSLKWLLSMTSISVWMDCWDHVRWPAPPPPPILLLIHGAAADVVMCTPPPFNLWGTWPRYNQQHTIAHGMLLQAIWKYWYRHCMKDFETNTLATSFKFILHFHRTCTI